MSSTTEILFNSPALHSLKRDQLVKLCKKHSLRASGKNVELIQRLRQHAQVMPKDSPLSIAARSDSDGSIPVEARPSTVEDATDVQEVQNTSHHSNHPRPSQQWEVVMDSIQEVEENSQSTLSSQRTINNNGTTGEFGTGSSKSSTVSSSIKALATSLGLKRNTSKSTLASSASSKRSAISTITTLAETNDELAQNSTPYSSLPQPSALPQTDHFTLNPTRSSLDGNTEAPLPGHALRPGVPAPVNARLSLGLGLGAPSTPSRRNQPTTTIRLISNPLLTNDISSQSFSMTSDAGQNGTPQLKPYNTTFDLILGSPMPGNSGLNFGFGNMNTWPPREEDTEMQGIYPTLTFDDLPPAIPSPTPRKSGEVGMPGSLTPLRQPLSSAMTPRSPDPFVFGSPLPQHNVSNEQFTAAAASVLEELNQRFREEGVEEITTNIITKLHPGAKAQETTPREIKPMPGAKRGEIKDMFAKKHEQEAHRMEGIDNFVRRRAPAKGLLETGEEKVVVGKKRKSSVLARDSSGGGGDGNGPRRPSVVASRASTTRVISNGRRAKALPGAFGTEDDEEEEQEPDADRGGKRVRMDSGVASGSATPAEDRKKLEREELEKEAIRKKLEVARARRRSSAVGGRKSVGRPRQSLVKPKPSRFGFLSSAKTLVQSVWNRGKAPPAPSNIPKATPTPAAKPEPVKARSGHPVLGPTKKSTVAPARPTPAVASGSRVSSIRASNSLQKPEEKSINTKGSIASSSRSRSPLPSFGAGSSSTRNSLQSNAGTRASRISSATGPTSRNSSVGGTNTSKGSTANVSSIGTRLSSARTSSGQATIGSMGTKRASSVTSKASGVGSSSRLSTSSRLLAPTASSLAKGSARPSGSGLKPVVEDRQAALGSITNSPAVSNNAKMAEAVSPRPGGIFSKPLLLPQQSGIPTPVKKRTLSMASNSSGEASENKQAGSAPGLVKQRSVNGRKPRISRSKVIAKLASQRAASGSSAIAPRASNGGKTRSSLGAKVVRASYGGGARSRASGGGNPIMSAKKRARQSEHARRKSRVGPLALGGEGENAMEIDG